jgi:hypothetical protein
MVDPTASPAEPWAGQPQGGPRRPRLAGRPLLVGLLGCALLGILALLAIPLGLIAGGAILLKSSLDSEAAANAYRVAPACSITVATSNCFTIEAGVISSVQVDHGKGGDTTNLDIRLPGRTESTWVQTSSAAENALQIGTSATVKLYQGQITVVAVPGFNLIARDNPIRVASDKRLAGLLLIGLGLLFLGILAIAWLQTRKGSKGAAALGTARVLAGEGLVTGVASAFPPGDLEPPPAISLPYTVRPQASPSTGRPWWVAPVALAIGFPWIAFQYRAPMEVLAITIVAGVTSAVLLIVLHTMYACNRRLVVDELEVTRTNTWGQKTTCSRSEIARVGLPTLNSFATSPTLEPRVVMLGHDGRLLLSLPRYFLTSAQAANLATAVRAPFDATMNQVMSRRTMERQWPGSVTWFERHIVLISVMVIPVLCAFVVFFVWAIDGFK